MRNSSTCFGRLTILRNAILNPLVFIQLGIEFGITLGISSLKFAPTHSGCHELEITSLKLFCSNRLLEEFKCNPLAFKCAVLRFVLGIKIQFF